MWINGRGEKTMYRACIGFPVCAFESSRAGGSQQQDEHNDQNLKESTAQQRQESIVDNMNTYGEKKKKRDGVSEIWSMKEKRREGRRRALFCVLIHSHSVFIHLVPLFPCPLSLLACWPCERLDIVPLLCCMCMFLVEEAQWQRQPQWRTATKDSRCCSCSWISFSAFHLLFSILCSLLSAPHIVVHILDCNLVRGNQERTAQSLFLFCFCSFVLLLLLALSFPFSLLCFDLLFSLLCSLLLSSPCGACSWL